MRLARSSARVGGVAAVVAAAAVALASCSVMTPYHNPGTGTSPSAGSDPTVAPAVTAKARFSRIGGERVCVSGCRYLGLALPQPTTLETDESALGVHPQIVVIYARFGAPFPATWARSVEQAHQLPVIQLNPYGFSLTGITAGQYDNTIRAYAHEVKAFGSPVILSFGHEMNGYWYPWGCRHAVASQFIAAYRHVWQVIHGAGASNVIWMWTPNIESPGDCPLGQWYPGDKYVTWVGLDGYLRRPGRTYAGSFGVTLGLIHKFTQRPILLAEIGVLIHTKFAPERITSLFKGAASSLGVIGVVYFDWATAKFGDYKPQDRRITLSAYQDAAKAYASGH